MIVDKFLEMLNQLDTNIFNKTAGIIILGLIMWSYFGIRFITLCVGEIYPLYETYKMLNSGEYNLYNYWLIYWFIYTIITMAELIFPLEMVPVYQYLKIIFLIWLLNGDNRVTVYNNLSPLIALFDKNLEQIINYVKNIKKNLTN